MMLALGSLSTVANCEIGGETNRVVFNPDEFESKIQLLKDQAAGWAEKAGFSSQETNELRSEIEGYLSRQNLSSFLNWGLA